MQATKYRGMHKHGDMSETTRIVAHIAMYYVESEARCPGIIV